MSMSNRRLEVIEPIELRVVWPTIREELASIETPDGFLPEDAYAACKSADAVLFRLYVDERYVGWMILRKIVTDLHIWLLHGKNGFDVMTVFREDLMKMAHDVKLTHLTFGSTRAGWVRVAPKHGFRVRHTVWECDVEPTPML